MEVAYYFLWSGQKTHIFVCFFSGRTNKSINSWTTKKTTTFFIKWKMNGEKNRWTTVLSGPATKNTFNFVSSTTLLDFFLRVEFITIDLYNLLFYWRAPCHERKISGALRRELEDDQILIVNSQTNPETILMSNMSSETHKEVDRLASSWVSTRSCGSVSVMPPGSGSMMRVRRRKSH